MKNEEYISRFKEAPFITEEPLDLIIGGAGGISSWLVILLSRLQHNLHIYDYDNYEAINIAGQFVDIVSIGKNKAEAIKELAIKFTGNNDIDCYGKYDKDSLAGPIMFSGFDNMEARKTMFNNWLDYVQMVDNKSECIFIDGRLLAENLQIFCILGNKEESILNYKENYLFEDSEVEEAMCTFKQTSHCAAMIASLITVQFTNFLVNVKEKDTVRDVPFYINFIAPLNYFDHVS